MNYRKTLSAVGMMVGLCLSSQAAILLPGSFGLDAPQAPGPAPLATLVTPYSNFGDFHGTVTSWVVRDPANPLGGLSFYYQVNNLGPESVSRLSAANFGVIPGAPVDVSTIVVPWVGGGLPGGIAPFTADRSTGAGSVVGFDFLGANQIGQAQWSEILVVNTPYQTYGDVIGSVIDNNSYNIGILGPVVPEPSTVMAGSLLLIPFAASALRIVRKR